MDTDGKGQREGHRGTQREGGGGGVAKRVEATQISASLIKQNDNNK